MYSFISLNYTYQKYIIIQILLILNLIYFCISDNHIQKNVYGQSKSIDLEPYPPGWIDPFDMLGDQSHNSPISNDLITYSDVERRRLKDRYESCELHWLRLVNTLLKAIEKGDSPSPNAIHSIKLDYLLFEKDYALLKKFVNNGGTSIMEVSNTLIKMFSQINLSNTQEKSTLYSLVEWLKKATINLITSPEWVVVSSVILLFVMTLWSVLISRSYRFGIFTAFLTLFFAGFGFTWMRMYEEQEAQRFANLMMGGREAPYHCRGLDMPWYQFLFYRVFGTDCYEFFKMRNVRTLVRVSPTEVLAETMSALLIHPMKNAGIAYSAFITSVIDHLPWYLKPIAVPFCFATPLVFIIIIMAFMSDYKLSIGITGIHLLPSWGAKPCISCTENHGYVQDMDRNRLKESSNEEDKTKSNSQVKDKHSKDLVVDKMIKNKTDDDAAVEENSSAKDNEFIKDKIPVDELPKEIKKRSRSAYTISSPNSASCSTQTSYEQRNDSSSGDQLKTSIMENSDDLKTK